MYKSFKKIVKCIDLKNIDKWRVMSYLWIYIMFVYSNTQYYNLTSYHFNLQVQKVFCKNVTTGFVSVYWWGS